MTVEVEDKLVAAPVGLPRTQPSDVAAIRSQERIKHLEFIHAVINRMSQNSFLLKGWTVTLTAALFALAQSTASPDLAVIAFWPALAIWGLDGFFLAQERRYRRLFHTVAETDALSPFCMDVSAYSAGAGRWISSTL